MTRLSEADVRQLIAIGGSDGPGDVDLYGADLSGLDLSGMNLHGADLQGANLDAANLESADLSDANLDLANLRKANLRKANLQRARLFGAELSDCDLTAARLTNASLDAANLCRSRLLGADVSGADLTDASFRDADLRGAITLLATQDGTDFQNAVWTESDLQASNRQVRQQTGFTPPPREDEYTEAAPTSRRIVCGECGAVYKIPTAKLVKEVNKATCKRCGHKMIIRKSADSGVTESPAAVSGELRALRETAVRPAAIGSMCMELGALTPEQAAETNRRYEDGEESIDTKIERLERAIEAKPNDVDALLELAELQCDLHKFDEALKTYNSIIFHAKEARVVIGGYLAKGDILAQRLKLYDKAANHYEKANEFAPAGGDPRAHIGLAECCLDREAFDEANGHIDRARSGFEQQADIPCPARARILISITSPIGRRRGQGLEAVRSDDDRDRWARDKLLEANQKGESRQNLLKLYARHYVG